MNDENKLFVNLNGVKLLVKFYNFNNGRKGFLLLNPDDESLVTRATINLTSSSVEENEVMIKNYEENKGIYNALVLCGFIMPYNRRIPIGNNFALICKLNTNYYYID